MPSCDKDVEAYGMETVKAPITKIMTSGKNGEYIHIGDTRLLRHELMEAVGASFSNQLHEAPSRKFANSSVLGLCALSLTVFVLGLIDVQAKGVTIPNIIVGPAWFYGGMVQVLVGIWEIVHENTFACCTFTSYGAFFLSFAALHTDSFGIGEAYADSPSTYADALGLYLIGWFIFSFLVTVVTIRSSWPLFLMFCSITLSFLLGSIGYLSMTIILHKIAGGFSIATAAFGWYMAFEGLASQESCYFKVSPFLMPGAQHAENS